MLRNMFKSILALVALLVASGCNANLATEATVDSHSDVLNIGENIPFKSDVSISADFSAEDQEVIVEAVDMWREASHGAVDLRLSIGGPSQLEIVPGSLKSENEDSAKHHVLGMAYDAGPGHYSITIDLEVVAEVSTWRGQTYHHALVTTAAHEIGHALGLPHLDSGLMMANKLFPGETIDSETVEALCSIRDCK
jgi:matrixin